MAEVVSVVGYGAPVDPVPPITLDCQEGADPVPTETNGVWDDIVVLLDGNGDGSVPRGVGELPAAPFPPADLGIAEEDVSVPIGALDSDVVRAEGASPEPDKELVRLLVDPALVPLPPKP